MVFDRELQRFNNLMKRRHFLKTTAGAAACCTTPAMAASEDPEEILIDVHQHLNYLDRKNEAMLRHQRAMGVSKTVLLPAGSDVHHEATHLGKSNGLAARVSGTAEAARLATEHPAEFVYFANEVPGIETTKAELEKWLKRGAVGIGEMKFGLACDSKEMRLVYDIAKGFDVPVLLHFEHKRYNHGFEHFHRILEAYPTVTFFGHAQTWWGNIDAKHNQAVLYPTGKVTPGGLTDKYLADYPNMFGDLSAGSGQKSLTRDLEHAAAFLLRHQDKLCFGSDCHDATGDGAKCIGAGTRDVIRKLVPDAAVLEKIFAKNARRTIMGLA
jgi:predicted TIM-barrel fold metal-dependent hydrolase